MTDKLNLNETFAQNLRRLREASGVSLRQFAFGLKLSPTFISKLERGEPITASEETIRAMATTLGVDPDEFLSLSGKISTDVKEIILEKPKEMADFLRRVKDASPNNRRAAYNLLKQSEVTPPDEKT
jgi:transcriptional regulator with XRE-family HTH domain